MYGPFFFFFWSFGTGDRSRHIPARGYIYDNSTIYEHFISYQQEKKSNPKNVVISHQGSKRSAEVVVACYCCEVLEFIPLHCTIAVVTTDYRRESIFFPAPQINTLIALEKGATSKLIHLIFTQKRACKWWIISEADRSRNSLQFCGIIVSFDAKKSIEKFMCSIPTSQRLICIGPEPPAPIRIATGLLLRSLAEWRPWSNLENVLIWSAAPQTVPVRS